MRSPPYESIGRFFTPFRQERHIAVVDKLAGEHWELGCDDLFKLAQRTVRWHYQWVVIHDFLPRIVGDAVVAASGEREVRNRVVDDILRREAYESGRIPDANGPAIVKPNLLFYDLKEKPFMPVEFLVAAYRFGHSMARPSYEIKDELAGPGVAHVGKEEINVNRIPLFDVNDRPPLSKPEPGCHPTKRVDYPDDGRGKLKPGIRNEAESPVDAFLPQPSYQIDTTLALPLGRLPDSTAKAQPLFGYPVSEAQSLPVRNLLRGLALGVPAGQDVARAMGIKPLEARGPDTEGDPDGALRTLEENRPNLKGKWPLWYYILNEAARTGEHGGAHLGPVGGRIVAEVLIGLLAGDRLSYLNVAPSWQPELARRVDGRFTLSDLVNFAQAPRAGRARRRSSGPARR